MLHQLNPAGKDRWSIPEEVNIERAVFFHRGLILSPEDYTVNGRTIILMFPSYTTDATLALDLTITPARKEYKKKTDAD